MHHNDYATHAGGIMPQRAFITGITGQDGSYLQALTGDKQLNLERTYETLYSY